MLLIAIGISGVLIKKNSEAKKYTENLANGNKFLEELEYKKAEESYLQAIKVKPKEKEPYLKLADVYVETEQYDKAEDILNQAEKMLDDSGTKKNDKTIKEEIEEKKKKVNEKRAEKISSENYTWIVNPTIKADDIYYVRDTDYFEKSQNGIMRQFSSPCAVVELDGKLSLIDMEGNLKADYKFDSVWDYYGKYMLHSIKPASEEELPSDYSRDDEWSLYEMNSNGELEIAEGLGGGDPGVYGYYWLNGLHYVDENSSYDWMKMDMPKQAIPVQKAEQLYDENKADNNEWWDQLSGKYAICKNSQLVSDFIYDECGSEAGGLLAVSQNGKWGYVNESGEIVIPIEFDASWKLEVGEITDTLKRTTKEYCYAADEGYIPLVKEGIWELRDMQNNQIILPGVFEEIRPLYKGKCWVKKDGKWGVIQIYNAVTENTDQTTETEEDNEIFTEEQIQKIRKSLSIPDTAMVTHELGTPFYWEAAGATVVDIHFYENGKSVASAHVDVETGELMSDILGYHTE